MRFTHLSVAIASAFVSFVNADSDSMTWSLSASGTSLDGYYVYLSDDSKFYIDSSTNSPITGKILSNTSFSINDHIIGVGRNYLSTVAQSAYWSAAEPFTVVDGYLKLFGSDFHAVPDGESDGKYVLGSINAAAGRSDMISVAISVSGVVNYPASSSAADSTSSTDATSTSTGASSTSTGAESTSSSAAATTETSSSAAATSETSSTGASASETTAESSSEAKSSETTVLSSSEATTESSTEAGSSTEVESSTQIETSSSPETSSSAEVSTYSGAAIKVGSSFGAVVLAALALI